MRVSLDGSDTGGTDSAARCGFSLSKNYFYLSSRTYNCTALCISYVSVDQIPFLMSYVNLSLNNGSLPGNREATRTGVSDGRTFHRTSRISAIQ